MNQDNDNGNNNNNVLLSMGFFLLQVKALFERVEAEQGRLDILVNNAFALGPGDQLKTKFWKQGVSEQSSYIAAERQKRDHEKNKREGVTAQQLR